MSQFVTAREIHKGDVIVSFGEDAFTSEYRGHVVTDFERQGATILFTLDNLKTLRFPPHKVVVIN